MTSKEEFETHYKKYRTEYFKKHFVDKNINEAIYETSGNIILKLTAILTEISMLTDCLCTLKSNKKFFSKFDSDCKRRFKINIIGLKSISKELDNILRPILEGLEGK